MLKRVQKPETRDGALMELSVLLTMISFATFAFRQTNDVRTALAAAFCGLFVGLGLSVFLRALTPATH